MTQNQQDQCAAAVERLSNIDHLEKRPEFVEWMAGQRQEVAVIELQILDDEMKPTEREELRNQRIGMLTVLNSFRDDRESLQKMLRSYGYKFGEDQA